MWRGSGRRWPVCRCRVPLMGGSCWRWTCHRGCGLTPPRHRIDCSATWTAGRWKDGDPDILIVFDAGYDVTRMAFLLADLPVQVLGRMRSDRVLRLPAPLRR